MSEKINILIVGSLGFIGSHAMQFFQLKEVYNCFGCDVLPGYGLKNYWQIEATNAYFKLIFAQQSFDFCINCSGAASVPDSLIYPERDFNLNVANVSRILEEIRLEQPQCKFIQLSSAAVYGNPQILPIKESTPPKPVSPYGQHKFMAELLIQEYVNFFGLKASILRLFSVYGPGLKKQLFWDWYQKALTTKQVEMWGTGNETRDFIFIDDVLNGLSCVCESANFIGEVYNLAGGKGITIKEAASYFSQYCDYKIEYFFNQKVRNGDPLYWQADISKIASLGFSPKTSLSDGLLNYLKWLQEKR